MRIQAAITAWQEEESVSSQQGFNLFRIPLLSAPCVLLSTLDLPGDKTPSINAIKNYPRWYLSRSARPMEKRTSFFMLQVTNY
ncbi:hypothetical protein A2244_00105 [Candidatus Peregrinibacteria bacterium RIFOXYA2_FULL_41_18]|nr:MAG: hypothetical protein A2244_00105 [Candidatus Peregrinibacteria bacterium RIFOXYA2_FULL_41_18]OGJ53280.1 MAG: hypothetical protein A2448_03760 [Candidatus Peregrinibacteria bacterium RIFOXYC2_FULL_41_22]